MLNMCCGYTLEAPRRGASNEYPQHIFYGEIRKKCQYFGSKKKKKKKKKKR